MPKGKMPAYAARVIEKINDAGYPAYAVGGCVRDTILCRRPNDWDVASAAPAEKIMELFPRTVPTGIKYGTVLVLMGGHSVEVTTFRREGDYLDGRRPESVEFISDIEEDLFRRDFTMNAMAMTASGEIIDPVGGREDIARRIIRTVGDPHRRFGEDALRMFRALRFSSQLGFDIDGGTLDAVRELSHTAAELSKERVRVELEKMLCSPRPEKLSLAAETGLLDSYLAAPVRDKIPMEGLARLPKDGQYRLCAFAAALANAEAIKNAGDIVTALGMSARTAKSIERAWELVSEMPQNVKRLRSFIARYGEETAGMTAAARRGIGYRGDFERVAQIVGDGGYTTVRELKAAGREAAKAGFSGGEINDVLLRLAVEVTEGRLENSRPCLIARLEEIKKDGI